MISVELSKRLMGSEGTIDLSISFDMPERAVFGIMGPSGVGKTSILKMLAGLLQPDTGKIEVDTNCWFSSDQQINLMPQQRSIGFVFQDYALFPNMSVRQNLVYALRSSQQSPLLEEVLQLMNMEKLQDRKPASLSGGQQQRVALARAIVRQPRLLLLDEPFAALDRSMREKLQEDLIHLHQRYGTTTLLVSHDMAEVARMAEEVIFLEKGSIIKKGNPASVFPLITGQTVEGEIIHVNQEKAVFILFSKLTKGLWEFRLPAEQNLKKGDMVAVALQQTNVRKL